jgi:hypothetical protein
MHCTSFVQFVLELNQTRLAAFTKWAPRSTIFCHLAPPQVGTTGDLSLPKAFKNLGSLFQMLDNQLGWRKRQPLVKRNICIAIAFSREAGVMGRDSRLDDLTL